MAKDVYGRLLVPPAIEWMELRQIFNHYSAKARVISLNSVSVYPVPEFSDCGCTSTVRS